MSSQERPPGQTKLLAWLHQAAEAGRALLGNLPFVDCRVNYRCVHDPEKVYSSQVILFFFSGQEPYIFSAELGEKCEAIGKKLLYLEDQLHTAIQSHDEELIHILFILWMKQVLGCFVKEVSNKYTVFPCLSRCKQVDTTVIYNMAHLGAQRLPNMQCFLSRFW